MKVMRGHDTGDIVFFFRDDGKLGEFQGSSLDLYRDWEPKHGSMKRGEERSLKEGGQS